MGRCDIHDGRNPPKKQNKRFRKFLTGERILGLDIPDEYGYMDPRPVALLRKRVPRRLPGIWPSGRSIFRWSITNPGKAFRQKRAWVIAFSGTILPEGRPASRDFLFRQQIGVADE
jgi:hypothetical protein